MNDLLKELGFEKVCSDLYKAKEFTRKITIAIENFRYVTQDNVDKFNKELRVKTSVNNGDEIRARNKKARDYTNEQLNQFVSGYHETYDALSFVDVKETDKIPPKEALVKMKEAKDLGCFDTFEVAFIDKKELKDPILFGRINGCEKRFFIAQWDDDVKIEDILTAKEG